MKTARKTIKGLGAGAAFGAALALAQWNSPAWAVQTTATMADFTSFPVVVSDSVAPMVMIAASNDHQHFFKAYNDYSDLNRDGIIETTYAHFIDYYGYFDSFKCYVYSNANGRFEPVSITANKYCNAGGPANEWSGNFLNWASMTRMDSIRKILFGGHRRVDTSTSTVLERAFLPNDAHSFAKHYVGADLGLLTPFATANTAVPASTSTTAIAIGTGSRTLTPVDALAQIRVGDFLYVEDSANPANFVAGFVTAYNTGTRATTINVTSTGGAGTPASWNVFNATNVGVTLCNTTVSSVTTGGGRFSQARLAEPPLIRAAQGNYALWAANERWQCRWSDEKSASNDNNPALSRIFAAASNPVRATVALNVSGVANGDYIARIQACVSGLEHRENCKLYPSGNLKPIGLFQRYGDDDKLLFGMMAGSYGNNKQGGDLMYDIGSMSREVNVTTDGVFKDVAASIGGPQADNQAKGMVNGWSLYRLVDYDFGDGTYNNAGPGDCTWGLNTFPNGRCKNWGNPFAEIYLNAIRYLAGESVSGTFRSNDSTVISGLNTPTGFSCPLGATNYCSRLSVVAINSAMISYDSDQLDANADGVDALDSSDTVTSRGLTNIVGNGEGITGNTFFVGEDGALPDDQLCTPKIINEFGLAEGICPEAPRLDGSYRVAGVAYYAHINDIRKTGSKALTGEQRVDTYAVAMSTGAPRIEVPVPAPGTGTVTIIPACRNTTVGGNCALVDFKIVEQNLLAGTGTFMIQWEDSEQGGDYDQDSWGTLSYAINAVANQVTITTDVHADSTPYAMGFGYVIAGTTSDGFHVHSGNDGFNYADPDGGLGCTNCVTANPPTSRTYNLGVSAARILQDPLWYAAKWGAFKDENGNNIPDLQSEWDRLDTDGNPVPDGIPDTFFFASNPQELEDSINKVFLAILNRASSGTAAAVVANSASGTGALYQAFFIPSRKDSLGNTAAWLGNLHGLWVDSFGLLREDANSNGVLDGYQTDVVIELFYDEVDRKTRLRRYASTSDAEYRPTLDVSGNPVPSATVDLDEIRPIWSARKRLSALTAVTTQRSYGSAATTGRFVKTWIDANRNGVVDAAEYVDFMPGSITSSNFNFFDIALTAAGAAVTSSTAAAIASVDSARSVSEVQKIVNFVRGEDQTGYRPRRVDYDGDLVAEPQRLGDIINSTPTVVGRPSEQYDLLYGDQTYGDFIKKYRNRRQMVYVGANDGMLHAFNAGFYDPLAQAFKTTPLGCTTCPTAHPLGSEVWAYVPGNLLPHLKWLTRIDYTHVNYVDGRPYAFDAKIFNAADPDYPGGWGTVLVVPARFGGGLMTVDTGNTGFGGAGLADDRPFSSSYIIMDVTNPEVAPKLLAEIRLPDSSFTVSRPAAVKFLAYDAAWNPTVNQWYLVFGNGPSSLTAATSATTAKLHVVNLNSIASGIVRTFDTGHASTFVAHPATADWDLDKLDNTVYFGTAGGSATNAGRLYRLEVNEDSNFATWTAPGLLLDAGKPITVTPTLSTDEKGQRWVFFGTGRLFSDADKASTLQQSFIGVRDESTTTTVSTVTTAQLENVTGVRVFTSGTITGSVSGYTSFSSLFNAINSTAATKKGWQLNLATGGGPAQRMITDASLIGEVLFGSFYTPNSNQCESEGTSVLAGLFYKTGTPRPTVAVFGTTPDIVLGLDEVVGTIDLGKGIASSPALHSGEGVGSNELTIFTQTSTGTVQVDKGKTAAKVRSGETDWRTITR